MLPPVPRLPALAALGRRETEAWQWQGPGQGHTPVVGEIGFLPSFRGMLGSSVRTRPPALRVQGRARVDTLCGTEKAWQDPPRSEVRQGAWHVGRGRGFPVES